MGLLWSYGTATDPHDSNRLHRMRTGRYIAALLVLILLGCSMTLLALHHGIGAVFTQVVGERRIETVFAERLSERSSRGGCRYQAIVEWPLSERNMTPCVPEATWKTLTKRMPVKVTYDSSPFGVLFQDIETVDASTPG